jgi:hypothetical protein
LKQLILGILILCLLGACNNEKKQIVRDDLVDSLISSYSEGDLAKSNDSVLQFWQNRINPSLPGLVSESKYAATLSMRYRLFGDIADIKMADSVIRKVEFDYNHKEAHPYLTLVAYSIMQHRFKEAEIYLQKAKELGLKKYDLLTASFDVDFELGNYYKAEKELKQFRSSNDYNYYYRRSKMDHLNGLLDSSIHAMLKAAVLDENSDYLKELALASAADLNIHASEMQKAADLYLQCIRLNNSDFHSIMGLGWIALVHDKNDSLADRIFQFVHTKNKLPDPIFKLTQMADERGDVKLQRKYAQEFELDATDSVYGNMYNKYMIELYTGILNNPAKAEMIAKRELDNRSTPQTYSWYAWSLYSNNKKQEAYAVYQQYVSGKPLEGLELYWMGKIMQGLNKGYNADQFFKAAYSNKYDLSPGIVRDLERNLE